ncbi:MAG: ABC transporter ATP-binding protein [Candidatus Eiseniibacteriota bacterium]
MAEPLLVINRLIKRFGGLVATDNLSLEVMPGEVHAIIGPNGAGKTTLIAQLAGELKSDSGTVTFDGTDITHEPANARSMLGLARSFQLTSIFRNFTALDNVALAVQGHAGSSFRFWGAARKDKTLRDPARQALARVGLGARADVIAGDLSHGEQRQLEIAMAIATGPRLLLLDEPMAGMGGEESARMVEILQAFKGSHTILLIEHDMNAVFALADRISVLVYGRCIATGSPEAIRANEEVRQAYLGEEEAVHA